MVQAGYHEHIADEFILLAKRIHTILNDDTHQPQSLPSVAVGSPYSAFATEYDLTTSDQALVTLALCATINRDVLLPFILNINNPAKRNRFGGIYSAERGQFSPTLQTGFFLLAGDDIEMLAHLHATYHRRHKLFTSGILNISDVNETGSFVDQQLVFNDRFLPAILYGRPPLLDSEPGFPVRRGHSEHKMNEVVLNEQTLDELKKLQRFARHMKSLWKLPDGRKYRRNFISVFSGDPGTGKSHTAEAIGNELVLPVYKVNLAQMVSKYIGETEKNLEKVFDRFSGHPNILFFDEAEAIFSKRTEVKDSHDKYANNEQSYLLQKIEDYTGIVILATNVQNLSQFFDKAFQRRIRQIVNFSFPEYPERLRLWANALGESFSYQDDMLDNLAKNYQLSGGSIYNVVSDCVVMALDEGKDTLTSAMVEEALKEEYKKTARKFERCTDDLVRDASQRYGAGYEMRRNF